MCDELGVAYPVKDGMPNMRPSGEVSLYIQLGKIYIIFVRPLVLVDGRLDQTHGPCEQFADGRLLEVRDKEVDPLGQPWGDDADSGQPGKAMR